MDRWVEETFHPHWRVRLEADEVLHEVKTDHQHLVIFKNRTWGTVLMLDGVCQLTTSDEFIYHEMMAHVPLMALDKPKRVLVVGGGDGGVMREVLKHPTIEKAMLCEIDREVIDTALKYYPEIPGTTFDDERTVVVIADGRKFVAETDERFDAIIVDSSEPIGPSAVLHTPEFFASCKHALKEGGILVTQNGLPFLQADELKESVGYFRDLFRDAFAYLATTPSYFGGPMSYGWATDDAGARRLRIDAIERRYADAGAFPTRYWRPDVHVAAFALPNYIRELVEA